MDSFLPGSENSSVVTVGMLPSALNLTTLLSIIQTLTPEARQMLLNKLGIGSEEDLRQLVGGAMIPAHVRTEAEFMKYPEYRAHKLLRLRIPPILLVLGTFGNIFSFLILRHKAMARQSTHHFLAALAITDSLVLYIGLFRQWVGDMTGFDPQTQSEWLCKSIVMLGYTCSNVSVWIIVAVTVERYIVVCHPLKAKMVCNVKRAQRAVMGMAAFFVMVNLHFLWTAGLTWEETSSGQRHSPVCNSEEGHEFLITAVWPWIDALLYGFGPFVIIFVLNIFIIVHVVRATSGRVSMQNRPFLKSPVRMSTMSRYGSHSQLADLTCSVSTGSFNSNNLSLSSCNTSTNNISVCSNNNNNNNNNNNDISRANSCSRSLIVPGLSNSTETLTVSSRGGGGGAGGGGGGGSPGGGGGGASGRKTCNNRRLASDSNLRLTVMLLTVSFTFLLTTLPMNISVIASAFWNQQSEDVATMSKFQLVFTVAELLMYLNHSVNFFLYLATGHKFRCEIVRMVCGKQRSNAAISDHSRHIYCSRNCLASGGFIPIRNCEETEL